MLYQNISRFITLILWVLLSFTSCVPPAGSSQNTSSSASTVTNPWKYGTFIPDKIMDDRVKSVRLFPRQGRGGMDAIIPAVFDLNSQLELILEFDVLSEDYDSYEISMVHCDKDWTISRLMPLEYMEEYNQIPIRDYDYSIDTKVAFVHYENPIPPVKRSGNYGLIVYPKERPDQPLFIRRFYVYENATQIEAKIIPSSMPALRKENHQLDFKVRYPSLAIVNPQQEVEAHLRQNQRNDQYISGLKAPFVREDMKELEYRYFDLETNFKAGNEFRFFDIGMRNFRGLNVASINEGEDVIHAYLGIDESRGTQAYSFWEDFNGAFLVQNRERERGKLDADYFRVHFQLKSPQIAEPVFVIGAMTNWQLNENNLMHYNQEKGVYETSILLKQGYYNYQYYVDNRDNPYHFEGSHFDTENDYEIFIYYSEIGARADRLVGYRRLKSNR